MFKFHLFITPRTILCLSWKTFSLWKTFSIKSCAILNFPDATPKEGKNWLILKSKVSSKRGDLKWKWTTLKREKNLKRQIFAVAVAGKAKENQKHEKSETDPNRCPNIDFVFPSEKTEEKRVRKIFFWRRILWFLKIFLIASFLFSIKKF